MTQSEEIVTLKGGFGQGLDSVSFYNNHLELSYRTFSDDQDRVEIRLSSSEMHQLETIQLIFVLKGNLQLSNSVNKSAVINIANHQHNLCRFIINETKILLNPGDEVVFINISETFLNRVLPKEHFAYQQLFGNQLNQDFKLLSALNMQITPEINAVLQKMNNFSNSEFSDQLLLESRIIELFALQLAQLAQIKNNNVHSNLKKMEVERMYEAREILINHQGDQLNLRTLAHLVGTNEFNLKRDFKLIFGKTVYAYLNQHKMEKAKIMLIEGDITIAEISNKMGYKHATHFTTAFKKYFGYLPRKIKTCRFSLLIFLEDFLMIFENSVFLGV